MHFEAFFTVEGLVILLLFIATVVAIAAERLRTPYTVGLVIAGLILAPFEQALLINELQLEITGPEIILGLLVPPLVFEAAFHLRLDELRRDFLTIFLLAVPGVIITTFMVGGIIWWATGIAFTATLLFGALVAATDPIAVIALFRTMGVPKRLQVLLEGESLFNDGTAIVVFNLVLATLIEGQSIALWESIGRFVVVAGGGILIGLMLGTFISSLINRITAPLIEATLTTVLAYGAYALAELLGVSGVLAVVAAGVLGGTIGKPRMSPTTSFVVTNLWEFAAFIANSFVFLVIGLEIKLSTLVGNISLILLAILTVLFSRAIVVFGFTWLGKVSINWQKVLWWGGLRGAISLALLLSLSSVTALKNLEEIQAMTFGIVLFTLLLQGTTMKTLVKRLNLMRLKSESQDLYERRHARAVASRAAYDHLQRMNQQGLLSEHTWETISPILKQRFVALTDSVRKLLSNAPDVQAEELDTAWRETLRAERATYTTLLTDGVISEETFTHLVSGVDLAMSKPKAGWANLIRTSVAEMEKVNYLAAAIIQEVDLENATDTLISLSVPYSQLPSVGGFLGRQNVTFLIGLAAAQVDTVLQALETSCSSRVEFASDLRSQLPIPLPATKQIRVGGVTIFMFNVEHYEEF